MRNVATKWNKWNKNKFQYFISISVYFITSKNIFFYYLFYVFIIFYSFIFIFILAKVIEILLFLSFSL